MDLLEFMMEIDIVMPFTIELDVLKRGVKRDVIYVFFFFFTITQKSKLILITLPIEKNWHCVML